jgi:hypothetical protein
MWRSRFPRRFGKNADNSQSPIRASTSSSNAPVPTKLRNKQKRWKILLMMVTSIIIWTIFTTILSLHSVDNRYSKKANELPLDPIQDPNNILPRVLVFVFPQFHEDSLNNYLWGTGFTDWNNLNKAPLKNRLGYTIPRPSDPLLGQYDYSLPMPRKRQGELAKEYGIDGFVFHHYWFYDDEHPGPNLHKPLINMLQDGYPDMPFVLHWCASKWTTTWSGNVSPEFQFKEPGVLQKQYFPIDDSEGKITEHYNWLKQFFHLDKYIKVNGRPVLMMYQKKPSSFRVLRRLQELAIQDGFPGLYFTVGLTKPHEHLLDIGNPKKWDPPPQNVHVTLNKFPFDKVVSYPNPTKWNERRSLEIPKWCLGTDEKQVSDKQNRPRDIAGIISSFDNTPRRSFEEANIWSSNTPDVVIDTFRKSLHAAIYYESCCFPNEIASRGKKVDDDRFILINAMNEWAEGMALEPSNVYGSRFLETIYNVKKEILEGKCNL